MHLPLWVRNGTEDRKETPIEIITRKQMNKLPLIIGANYRKLSLGTASTRIRAETVGVDVGGDAA